MLVLSGLQVSEVLREKIKIKVAEMQKKYDRVPGLAVVIVGEDPASQVYVRNKIKACQSVGIESRHIKLPQDTKEEDLIQQIEALNADPSIHGILVQLPLPQGINADRVVASISPDKDADGLQLLNVGRLYAGQSIVQPCTPSGVIEILQHYKIPMAGKNAVVIGRSAIVGRPMGELLLQQNATVTICHSHTKDLKTHTQNADIVVVAAGRPRAFGKEYFAPGSVVIDVGIHRRDEGLCGDVRWEELEGHVGAATPVPGGVGPMTITMLLHNTCLLGERALRSR